MTPKIDIIVPVYNAKKYLAKCIRSIQKQTFTNWRLILVDDGSTDGCAEICDRFAVGDSRIFVVHQENKGLIGARKTGLANATSEFIAFVDADDLAEPEMLQKLLEAQEQYSADIVCCGHKTLSRRGWIKRSHCKNHGTVTITTGKEEAVRIASTKGYVTMWGKMYKRSAFLKVQDLLETLPSVFHGEDTLINTIVFSEADRVIILSDELYDYRIGGGSTVCTDKTLRELSVAYRWRKDYLVSVDAEINCHKANLDMVLHAVVYLANKSKQLLSREKICTALAYVIADIDWISPNYKHKDAFDLNIPMTDKEFKNIYHESPTVIFKQYLLRIF